MQQSRPGIDAQVYLDGLFNELHEYLERKNQILKEAIQNPKNCICSPKGFGRSINHGRAVLVPNGAHMEFPNSIRQLWKASKLRVQQLQDFVDLLGTFAPGPQHTALTATV